MAGASKFSKDFRTFLEVNDLLIDVKRLLISTKKISEGGSSTVYEGSYKEQMVAVKMLEPPVLGTSVSRELRKKFKREVTLLNTGRHDNVVRLIGASIEPKLLIITELMQGGSLKSYLWNIRPARLDLQQSVRFALDISRAMEHLHANNIIHRDLKPGNLVLAADHRSLKVADFGISHEGNDTKYFISEPRNKRWMAPELFIRKRKLGQSGETSEESGETSEESGETSADKSDYVWGYNHKVDIYSFSIVLLELLTNETLSKADMSKIPDSVPEDLVHLLKTCSAEEPTERPEFTAIIVKLSDILNTLA